MKYAVHILLYAREKNLLNAVVNLCLRQLMIDIYVIYLFLNQLTKTIIAPQRLVLEATKLKILTLHYTIKPKTLLLCSPNSFHLTLKNQPAFKPNFKEP